MNKQNLPQLPLAEWQETKTTIHLYTQIVGKIRLMLHPKLNHWWHAPLYVSARGLTTRPIPYDNGLFDLEFDFTEHQLKLRTSEGKAHAVALEGNNVANCYSSVRSYLSDFGISFKMLPKPFDSSKVKSEIEFKSDTEHKTYNKEHAQKFWQMLCAIDPIFKEFRGRFIGKCSPVHFFWHSFDLAVTRFSGRTAPVADNADSVTKEAYSHDVISSGFWPGDDNVPEPCFYTYVHPEPKGLEQGPLSPGQARWQKTNGTHMALYKYEDFRNADDPRDALLKFLQSSYEAGANLAKWPRKELEYKN